MRQTIQIALGLYEDFITSGAASEAGTGAALSTYQTCTCIMNDQPTGHRWFDADADTIRGVVVLVHGLNQHPATCKDMITALNEWGYHVFRLCPTRIVMRKNDELIHYRGVKRLIRRHRLNSYETLTLPEDNTKRKRSKRNHLIIDKKGLGKFAWHWMLKEIPLFLGDRREDRLTPVSR